MVQQLQKWWKESSVYQIYPASYCDSNDDGIGDLPGIISKVDYMHKLGVDLVWLSPILKSPQVDMGYDISDYKTIDAQYGTLSDVDALIAELKKRDMKLVMDLVVNHTSDQHDWFKQSRSSKDNPYRDWYIWKPAKYDADGTRQPPNNWLAEFQGSAWEWDELTQEYYLHVFAVEQPDLNWENAAVRAAVHDIMRFWLDRGSDGFRMDVINMISKDQAFPDAPVTKPEHEFQDGSQFYACGPRLHEYLAEMGDILKEYDAFSVGEMPYVSDSREIIKAVGGDRGELSMIFIFDLLELDHSPKGRFLPREILLDEVRTIVEKYQKFMYDNDGWNSLYIENHDQPRSVDRFGCSCPKHRVATSKLLATFLGCQAGTPFIYEGQELGMTNVPKDWAIEEYKDILTQNSWTYLNTKTKDPKDLKIAMEEYQKKSRDNARTPMQWTSAAHGGFTSPSVTPWMRANDNFTSVNAESQVDDPDSPFSFWAKMLRARKQYKDILVYGDFSLVEDEQTKDSVLAFARSAPETQRIVVACNFSGERVEWSGLTGQVEDVVLSNFGREIAYFAGEKIALEPYEAFAVVV